MKARKSRNESTSSFILPTVFIIGMVLLLYPSVSNYYNSFHASSAISNYSSSIADMTDEETSRIFDLASQYNSNISKRENLYVPSDTELFEYNNLFNVGGDGMMGSIEIPKIDVNLPIYHGTDDAVLSAAVGHIEWTSLPSGGDGCHTVLSGHRGLPSARLFTDLDKLEEGDVFYLHILGKTMTYRVDKISIVLPQDVSMLKPVPGRDLCTLVTCTPYGINTHRLLVQGYRVDSGTDNASVNNINSDALIIPKNLTAGVLSVPLVLIAYVILIFIDTHKCNSKKVKGKHLAT